MSKFRGRLAAVFAALVGLAASAGSATAGFTTNTIDRGNVQADGTIAPGNFNFAAGTDLSSSGNPAFTEFRNFFVFNLPTSTIPITSASLRLFNPAADPSIPVENGFQSPDATETFTLFDVTAASRAAVTIDNPDPNFETNVGPGVFTDLGSGVSFGSATVSNADNGRFVTINLNAAGLAALNASLGQQFAIGGAITTLRPNGTTSETAFAFTDNNSPNDGFATLIALDAAVVPVPPTVLAGLAGALGLGWARRRRAA